MKVRVRIKSTHGEIPANLTIGKIYDAEKIDEHRIRLACDDGQVITSNIKKSGYLSDSSNGGEWEVLK